jgi:hypothetical protein
MFDGAVGSQILHDLSIDVEEDFDFILREIGILVFVVKVDGRVQKGLPNFVRVVFPADFNRIIQNLLDFDVRCEALLIVVMPCFQDSVDSKSCNFD